MVEEKKELLVKVDILNNVVGSLTKYVSIENLSQCRETIGITCLDC